MDFFIQNQDSMLAMVSHCTDLLDDNKGIKVTVKDSSKRSLSQNNLMWMWYSDLCSQIKLKSGEGYSTDDLHEYFKSRFCPTKELKFGDKTIEAASTTRLDTGEMTRFLDQIHEWAIGAGFKLTIPIDCEYREMIERQCK